MDWFAFLIFVCGGFWSLTLVWCVFALFSYGYTPRHASSSQVAMNGPYNWETDGW